MSFCVSVSPGFLSEVSRNHAYFCLGRLAVYCGRNLTGDTVWGMDKEPDGLSLYLGRVELVASWPAPREQAVDAA